jgi:hypothetical protein
VSLFAGTFCDCGSFSSGTFHFEISDEDADCCESAIGETGYARTWELNGKVWKLVESVGIRAADARSKCCNLS